MLGLGLKNKWKNISNEAALLLGWTSQNLALSTRRRSTGPNAVVMALDFDLLYREDDDSGRYAYWVSKLFSDAGYTVCFMRRTDLRSYRHLQRYGRWISSIPNVRFISQIPMGTENMMLVFDDEVDKRGLLKKPWKKVLYMNALKSPVVKVGETQWIPYPMHPMNYVHGLDKRLSVYRSHERSIRAFFGGNTAREYYGNPKLKTYGQMTRLEGLEALTRSVPGVRVLESTQELERQLKKKDTTPSLVLFKSDHASRIPSSRWLDIVSRCDFFVGLSGTDMPMCHNAIESLAVGTIPILSYQDWFFPALEHGKNALVYSDEQGLLARVQEALTMKEEDVQRLRWNAAAYYDEHLSQRSFIRQVESGTGKVGTLMLYPRLVPSEEEARLAKTRSEQLAAHLAERTPWNR